MNAWLFFSISVFLLPHKIKCGVNVHSTTTEMATVWAGIGNLFCDRFNQDSANTNCRGNNETLTLITEILTSMNGSCEIKDQRITNIQSDQCTLQNFIITKNSLRVLSKSLFNKYRDLNDCSEIIRNYSKVYKDLDEWLNDTSDYITWSDSYSTQVSNAIQNPPAEPLNATYLNSYMDDFAALSDLTNSSFYSTTMEGTSAFAPIIRGSERIMFLQNIDDTMAKATYELIQNIQGGFTFIYDDENKLFLLIRRIKNIYFTTYNLSTGWRQNETHLRNLKERFQSDGNPHTYVLLFKQETSDASTQEFLHLALKHQQLRRGIQVILLSTQERCIPYTQFIHSGATLITFATSTTYAPTTPDPNYKPEWKISALYLDGLAYITQNKTQVPSEYILSIINFDEREPTSSPVESMTILDCTKDTNKGIGSYVRRRNPVMVVTSINSTIVGRTIRVGIVKYSPFFDNGTGFSMAVLSKLATTANIHYAITLYDANPDKPYYAAMEEAIAKNDIDVGFTPMPMVSIQNGQVAASRANMIISYTLLRQRQSRPTDYLLILRPLAMPVWLASCFLGFVFVGLLMLFGHLKPVIMKNLAEGEMTTKTDLFEVSSLGVASSFSLTKLQIIPTTLSSRIFALVMWLFSYLLLVIYASAMMTIMLKIQKPINDAITVDEVLHPSNCDSIIVLKNGIAYDQIIASVNNSHRNFTPVDDIQTAYNELMKSKKTVLLASSIEASYISVMDCELELIPYTEIYDSLLTFPYNSGWEFGSAFDEYLEIVEDAGVFSNAASVYFETGPCYHPPYKTPRPVVLELRDTASIYVFLLVGVIVSFILLGIEFVLNRRKNDNFSRDYGFLVQGRRYPATIVSMKRNGLHVKVGNWPDAFFIPNSQLHPNPLKVYNALDLGLHEGETIEVVYFGKDADSNTELFCRYCPG